MFLSVNHHADSRVPDSLSPKSIQSTMNHPTPVHQQLPPIHSAQANHHRSARHDQQFYDPPRMPTIGSTEDEESSEANFQYRMVSIEGTELKAKSAIKDPPTSNRRPTQAERKLHRPQTTTLPRKQSLDQKRRAQSTIPASSARNVKPLKQTQSARTPRRKATASQPFGRESESPRDLIGVHLNVSKRMISELENVLHTDNRPRPFTAPPSISANPTHLLAVLEHWDATPRPATALMLSNAHTLPRFVFMMDEEEDEVSELSLPGGNAAKRTSLGMRLSVGRRSSSIARRPSMARRASSVDSRGESKRSSLVSPTTGTGKGLWAMSAKDRWGFALTSVMKMIQATRVFGGPTHMAQGEERGGDGEGGGAGMMANQLQNLHLKEETMLAGKIVAGISVPWSFRTEEQQRVLHALLLRIPAFAKFQKPLQMELMKGLKSHKVGPGRMIIKEGRRPTGFYFLISGTARSFQGNLKNAGQTVPVKLEATDPDQKPYQPLRVLKHGDMFGDFRIGDENDVRQYSVVTISPCDLLFIEKDDYIMAVYKIESERLFAEQIAAGNAPDSLATRIEFLSRLPSFQNTEQEVLRHLARSCHRTQFEPGTCIVRPGQNADREQVYFILQGKVKLLRTLPFLRSETKPSKHSPFSQKSRYISMHTLTPYLPGDTVPLGHEATEEVLSIGELGVGEMFPQAYILEKEILTLKSKEVSNGKIRHLVDKMAWNAAPRARVGKEKMNSSGALLTSYDHKGRRNSNAGIRIGTDGWNAELQARESVAAGLDLRVIATQRVECLVVGRMDFLRKVDDNTFSRCLENDGVLGIPVLAIEENFLRGRTWEQFKRRVITGVVERSKRKAGLLEALRSKGLAT
ncbi:hypothetical protein BJ742DRAFT_867500 [Cladochytrium replicatum]|nr:hypothetical protein BJ742DRAFT_867500 [Cladochytrium replicatum]